MSAAVKRRRRPCAECGKRPRAFGLEWCRECYEQIKPVDGSLGFSLRTAPQRPHDVEVDLASIWGNPDAVIAAVRDALAAAGIDPGRLPRGSTAGGGRRRRTVDHVPGLGSRGRWRPRISTMNSWSPPMPPSQNKKRRSL